MCIIRGPTCPIENSGSHLWCDVCNGVIDGSDDDQPRIFVCWKCLTTVYSDDDGETYVCGKCGRTPEEWMAGHGEIVQLCFPFVDCARLFGGELILAVIPGTIEHAQPSPRPWENELFEGATAT